MNTVISPILKPSEVSEWLSAYAWVHNIKPITTACPHNEVETRSIYDHIHGEILQEYCLICKKDIE